MGFVGVISSHVVLGMCAVVLFLLWGAALWLGPSGRGEDGQAHGQSQAQLEQPQTHQAP
jgi:hypothetical protein